jgi:transcriptional regulator GlxA family with amidase domain
MLLDNRRTTTHWAHARALQTTYPKVKVEEDRIFMVNGGPMRYQLSVTGCRVTSHHFVTTFRSSADAR